MLSRIAVKSATQSRACLAVVSSRDFATGSVLGERDLVNFPMRVRPIDKAPVRLGLLPAEWFDALYPKTGVTGPYMAVLGVSTFLCSKEYFVMEHDFYVGIALAIVLGGIIKNVGPSWTESINKLLDDDEASLRSIRQNEIDYCMAAIAGEKQAQTMSGAWVDIIAAKKEAVGLQLEAEYRGRLASAHAQVKKRLDYQLETANVMRRMEQKHMVDWIIGNVKASITPAQEAAALKKCISDLKALSV
jgi:F-type H+-transporting ATPase subunit b